MVFSNCEVSVRELTRSFSQEELMDFQWDLLIANFKDPKTVALVRDRVDDISPGSSFHRASVLKIALKKAFELKKKKRQPPGVLLRCSNSNCTRYRNHVSCSKVGLALTCSLYHHPHPWGIPVSYYFQCVSCGSNRTGNYKSCKECGVRFA